MASREKEQGLGNCPICGRVALRSRGDLGKLTGIEGPSAAVLKDGSALCGSCVRRMRVMYPLGYTYDEAKVEVITRDPLCDMTAEDVTAAVQEVTDFREDLREQYGYRNAVFQVDAAAENKGGFMQAPLVTAFGHVIYGTFFMFEEVTILSGGTEMKAPVAAIDKYNDRRSITAELLKDWMLWMDPGTSVGENGYPCKIILQGKGINVKPGDLIVK